MSSICKLCGGTNLLKVHDIAPEAIATVYVSAFSIDLNTVGCEPPARLISMMRCIDCELKQFTPDWIGSPGLYEALQGFPWYYQKSKYEFQVAKGLVRPGDTVLEVGCATGNFRQHLPDGISYLGLEFNQKAIDEARLRGLDVCAMPLEQFAASHAATFDSVFAFQVLEHVPQPRKFLLDMVSAVKPGGLVVFSVPSEDSFLRYEVNNVTNLPPHHATRWPDVTFERLGDIIGAHVVDVTHEPLSSDHYRSYASAQVWRIISSIFSAGRNGVSPAASNKLIRRAITLAALPICYWTAMSPIPVRGHTVTVTLRKV